MKRLFILFVSVIMISSSVIGCNNKSGKSGNEIATTKANDNATQATAASATETAAFTEQVTATAQATATATKKVTTATKKITSTPKATVTATPTQNSLYNFNGKNITICVNYNKEFYPDKNFALRASADDKIESLYNVSIQYITDLASAETAAIAGYPIVDFVFLTADRLSTWIKANIAEPLNNYTSELKLNDSRWDQTINNYSNINGIQYAVGTAPQGKFKYKHVYAMLMNKDLLKKCNINIEDIYTKQTNKNWDWDEFSAITAKITRDLNGDDIPDVYGTTVGGYKFLDALCTSNQSNYIQKTYKGFTFDAGNKVIQVMDYLYSLVRTTSSRAPEIISGIPYHHDYEDFINDKIGFNVQKIQDAAADINLYKDKFGVLCIPMAPNTADYYFTDSLYYSISMFINQDKERVKDIAKFIYLYNTPLYNKEEENKYYWSEANNLISDKGSKYFFEKVYDHKNVILINNTAITQGLPFFIDPIYEGEKTAKQIIEEQTPACKSFMELYFG